MEKNENGYPRAGSEGRETPGRNAAPVAPMRDGNMNQSAPMPNGNRNQNSTAPTPNGGMDQNSTAPNPNRNRNGSGNGRIRGGDCGEPMNHLDSLPLAYVYAPHQRFCMLYSAEDALSHGTLFEALYKPKEVYGRE